MSDARDTDPLPEVGRRLASPRGPSGSWSTSGPYSKLRSPRASIYEIDGKPALEVLQEYLPGRVLTENWGQYVLTLALCFRAPSYMKDDECIFRAVLSVDATDGSVTLATEVQEGTSFWFSSRDQEKVTTGLDRMAQQIKEQLGGAQPKLVFHFDCCARGKIMFRDQEKVRIFRQFRRGVGPEAPWAGFNTFGEIGPVGEHNCYHNYTAVVLALG